MHKIKKENLYLMNKALMVILAMVMALTMVIGSVSIVSAAPLRIPVTGILITTNYDANIRVGSNGFIQSEITPVEATNQKVSWSSSNRKVATVTACAISLNAMVKGVSPGTVTITAKTADGRFTDSVEITVVANSNSVSLPYTQDFAGVGSGLPAGWNELYGMSSYYRNIFVATTNNAGGELGELRFDYCDPNLEIDSRAVSPKIDATTTTTALNLSFKHYLDIYTSGDPTQTFNIAVEVSANGGRTWDVVYVQNLKSGDANIGPETVNLDLSAYLGKTIMISWRLSGYSYNMNYWYIDDVSVTGS
jgi:hypothetical protein